MATQPVRRPDAKPQAADDDLVESSRMSFGDHLDELRSCLMRALVGVAMGVAVSLVFGKDIVEIICRPLYLVQRASGLQPQLQALAPMAGFAAYLKIGFLSGLIVAMPWVLHQIWRFVATGLYPRERRFLKLLVPSSILLFVLGVLFLYFIVLPIVLGFFISFNQSFELPNLRPTAVERLVLPDRAPVPPAAGSEQPMQVPILTEDPPDPKIGDVWVNGTTRRWMLKTKEGIWSIPLEPGAASNVVPSQFALDFFLSFVLILALAFGIAFETPIVVFFLAWTGIVTTAAMARGRRFVLLAIIVLAAILTPPDVISQLLLAVPMYLLFELGLLIGRAAERETVS